MTAAYRILVTGSRDWDDEHLIRGELSRIWLDHGGPVVIVHGACPTGADSIAAQWVAECESHGYPGVTEDRHPADWDTCARDCPGSSGHRRDKREGDTAHPGLLADYCPTAGPRRNRVLVRLGADRCLAFIKGGSIGASRTAGLAESAGIPTRRWTT